MWLKYSLMCTSVSVACETCISCNIIYCFEEEEGIKIFTYGYIPIVSSGKFIFYFEYWECHVFSKANRLAYTVGTELG